jgi:hypothetical protein
VGAGEDGVLTRSEVTPKVRRNGRDAQRWLNKARSARTVRVGVALSHQMISAAFNDSSRIVGNPEIGQFQITVQTTFSSITGIYSGIERP